MQRFISPIHCLVALLATACLLTLTGFISFDLSSRTYAVENQSPRISKLQAGPNVQYELQSKLIDAMPGDVIELAEGHFQFHRQLDITTSHLTIRGAGSNKTVLSLKARQQVAQE